MEVICFIIGVLFAYTLNAYLPLAVLFIYFISLQARVILCSVLGLGLALGHQWLVSPQGMPKTEIIPHALISGVVASIPEKSKDKTRFNFAVERLNGESAKSLVQLSWYNKVPLIEVGQRWQLTAKLKKPHNFQNPGSSDYAGSLWSRHIQWTGYVRPWENNRLQNPKASRWNSLYWRQKLGLRLEQLTSDKESASMLQALSLNLTQGISQAQWELFRRTGTIHLFSISGEHIALIWGMIFFLMRWLWSRSMRLCLYLPAQWLASIVGLFAALVYSVLAGFGPPVQRALVGCFFYTVYCLGKRRFDAWQIWRYALVAVVSIEPHAVFMQGFYFSFIAVACLLLTSQRWPLKGLKQQLALQLACLLGLMPLSLYWFSYGSINGFLANAFAIPLMGFLMVPLALLTLAFSFSQWTFIFIKPFSWLLALLFKGLIWIESLSFINLTLALPKIEYVLSLMGALLLSIALPIHPFRGLAILGFFIPFLPTGPFLHKGEALVDVLDVGQGLSVSIRTKSHVLLYDTGDKYFQGSDLGKMVILPFYKAMNVKQIDTIVISHPDKDHRGGLESVESGTKVHQLLVNNHQSFHRGLSCHHYPSWEWDGVKFRFFPIRTFFKNRNNLSCVLQVSTSKGRFLLTGDIEAEAEDYLVRKYGNALQSEFLLVPHHASKTSSSYRFLLEVAPQYAIASLGFDNRFHFPHTKTLSNFKHLGIAMYRTDTCGMVEVLLGSKEIKSPSCYAKDHRS